MSGRYSHGSGGDYRGSDGYRGSGGGYRGGYDNGHRSGGYQSYGKINEDDVPESQHSIFVRGLPSSITYDEIKNFFEDNIGPCSFDFQKVNYERQSLFVAVRFETKEHAKEAYNKYRDEDILGCRCEVTWFRDIRRYISYQQQTGGVIRRGSFGRGRGFHNNYNRPSEHRKRRYSDDRRSRSRSYSDSDRSRSRSRRSSKSRSSRSRSRSEGERSSSRDSDRRRSESKEDKRKDRKKEKKVKKSKKDRRSRRSESASSRSDGERSRSSSQSVRDVSPSKKRTKTDRREREVSPASSTGSPLRMTPPPPAPTIIGPIIPSTTSTPAPEKNEKSAPLSDTERSDDDDFSTRAKNGKRQRKKKSKNEEKSRWENDMEIVDVDKTEKEHTKIMITIANKSTVPVENTSFKMSLDGDEPPRKIVRGPLTPEKKEEDDMEVEEKEEEVPLRKENIAADPKEKGGWRTVGDNSGPPSDVVPETLQPPPPAPTLVQPTLAKVNGSPEKAVNGVEMVPRSVNGPPPPSMGTPNPPPPKRPPMGTPSSLPPPPGRPSLGGGAVGALATRCPEMAKTIKDIKAIQDQLVASVKPNQLRLSDLASGESMLEKMEERERLIGELDQIQKNKFDFKMKQIANSYKGDAQTITTVIKSVVQKDPSLEDQIKPALLSVLEDLEKQIYKKVDDFLVCGL